VRPGRAAGTHNDRAQEESGQLRERALAVVSANITQIAPRVARGNEWADIAADLDLSITQGPQGVGRTTEDSMITTRTIAALAALPIAAGITFSGTAQAATRPAQRGLDIASFQHPNGAGINWRRVADHGYKFVFIKATQSDNYVNPYYAADRAGAEKNGLKVGAYAFAIPNASPGWKQADYLLANMGHTTLAPVLDIEWNVYGANCYSLSPSQIVSWVASFERAIHRHLHEYAIINTPQSWWNACTARSTRFGTMPLWDENNHNSTPSRPVLPAGWTTWLYWQKSITGHIPGIVGYVDIDVKS
jgi:lysozyme